jgi:hypothetical protein
MLSNLRKIQRNAQIFSFSFVTTGISFGTLGFKAFSSASTCFTEVPATCLTKVQAFDFGSGLT